MGKYLGFVNLKKITEQKVVEQTMYVGCFDSKEKAINYSDFRSALLKKNPQVIFVEAVIMAEERCCVII